MDLTYPPSGRGRASGAPRWQQRPSASSSPCRRAARCSLPPNMATSGEGERERSKALRKARREGGRAGDARKDSHRRCGCSAGCKAESFRLLRGIEDGKARGDTVPVARPWAWQRRQGVVRAVDPLVTVCLSRARIYLESACTSCVFRAATPV
jgi:hypothetical protein